MRHDHADVRIHGAQLLQRRQMRGCLEDPTLAAAAPLQLLEKVPMQPIGRKETLRAHPPLIRGHDVHGAELRAEERVAENNDTLFGQPCTERMDLLEFRHQPLEPAEVSLGDRDAWVAFVGVALWRW